MLPLTLTLQGVYSYREKQTIDFQSLTGGGIFGIFGPVGAGKSAILEAITYALYGQIERLGEKDQRGYNMMNLQSEKLFIDFEFSHNRSRYRFTVAAKRQKKNFQGISPPERQGYAFQDGQWVPLKEQSVRGGVTAEPILGLTYEHFRRTVIIPQGKFQEFIQLTPAQRTGMIESLFQLERFNLYGRASSLLGAAKSQRAYHEGRMEELQKFRAEDLAQLEERLKESKIQLSGITEELKSREEELRRTEETRDLRQEETALASRQEDFKDRRPAFEERLASLERYREIHGTFHPLMQQKNALEEERDRRVRRAEQVKSGRREIQEALEKDHGRWQRLQDEWADRESLREQLRSLKAAGEIRRLERETARLGEEMDTLNKAHREHQVQEEQKAREKEGLLAAIAAAEQLLPDWEEIREIEEWFRRDEATQKEAESLEEQEAALRRELEGLRREFSAKLLPATEEDPGRDQPFDSLLREKRERLEKDRQQLREEQIRLQTEKKLFGLSGDLKEGLPCPVCGSPHHPTPLSAGDFEESELRLKAREESLRENEKEQAGLERAWNRSSTASERIREELERAGARRKSLQKGKEDARQAFPWPRFDPDRKEAFFQELKKSQERQAQLREDYRQLQETEKALKELSRSSEGFQKRTRQIDTERSRHTASGQAWSEQLSEDHRAALPEDPQKEYRLLEDQLSGLEKEYPLARERREKQESRLAELEKEFAASAALLEELEQREKEWEASFQHALASKGIRRAEEVADTLSRNLDIPREQAEIDRFFQEKAILEDRLKTLRSKLTDREYDPERHRTLKEEIARQEKKRAAILSAEGALRKEREDLTTGLAEKAALEKALKKTRIREENLKELTSLFKGKKFTEYIASIYLQELCRRANERFLLLSGNTLELIFDNNAILVRDYLNDGKTRLVKTLSGGQTFQAALSLALALADQIGLGENHFFFLDEGFGTLDRETLETVMRTLRTISGDGRVIGLISHVEDLRQDLDVWIQIDRPSDGGSRITSSWTGKEGEE